MSCCDFTIRCARCDPHIYPPHYVKSEINNYFAGGLFPQLFGLAPREEIESKGLPIFGEAYLQVWFGGKA
jgi:hypothetical protein